MKKNDFIKKVNEALPEDFNLSQKDLNEIFDIMFDTLSDVVVDEGKFAVPVLGTFTVIEKPARKGVSKLRGKETPWSKEAYKTLKFKIAPKLKERLN